MRLRFGEFTLDTETRSLTKSGEPVHLTPKAFQLLELLLRERPRALSKQALFDRIWPDVVVDESNLKSLILEIRRAVDSDTAPSVITTVQRFGYSFSGDAWDEDERPAGGYRLHVEEQRYPLRAGVNVVGRSGDCNVCIDSVKISRRHARITITPQLTSLEDLGSKNGTWVNDVRLDSPAQIRPGDEFRLGTLVVRFGGPSEKESTASESKE